MDKTVISEHEVRGEQPLRMKSMAPFPKGRPVPCGPSLAWECVITSCMPRLALTAQHPRAVRAALRQPPVCWMALPVASMWAPLSMGGAVPAGMAWARHWAGSGFGPHRQPWGVAVLSCQFPPGWEVVKKQLDGGTPITWSWKSDF